MPPYYPPTHKHKSFHCMFCGVFAVQHWSYLVRGGSNSIDKHVTLCSCSHCGGESYWHDEKMTVPCEAPVPPAHIDMPEGCEPEYDEARSIAAKSPRAAAAIMRLALQKLLLILGEKGSNINDDIGSLVQKGLPVEIQQALDFCRVIGNNAVHPGEIEINDTPEIALTLFEMLNLIVEDRIARPKKIQEAYNKLPEGARAAIEKRDEKAATVTAETSRP